MPDVNEYPVVDVHSHAVPLKLLQDVEAGRDRYPGVRVKSHEGAYVLQFGEEPPTRPIAPGLLDVARRGSWMGDQGIDRIIVSGWLDAFGYGLPAREGAAWSERLTHDLVEQCRNDPLAVPLATLPMQDPVLAADALGAAVKVGCPGAMIATRIGERALDDPAYTTLFEAADELQAVLYLHPGFGGCGTIYNDYGLVNGLARLEETTITVARLLYAGIPERYPGMRLVVSHGGGSLPYVIGRLMRNWIVSGRRYADPLEQLRLMYFDTVVFDEASLRLLIDRVGANHVMLGSDYPFPIGDPEPLGVVDAAALGSEERGQVLGCRACELFGLAATGGSDPTS